VNVRLAAAAVAVFLAFPDAGSAGDNPWSTIKKAFREPVTELKQQFKQLKARGATAPKAKVAEPDTSQADASQSPAQTSHAPPPIPVARPEPQTFTTTAPESIAAPAPAIETSTASLPTTPLPTTPLQGNSPILIDGSAAAADAGVDEADVAATQPVAPVVGAAGTAAPIPESAQPAPVVAVLPPPADEPDAFESALAPIPRPRPGSTIAYAAVGREPSSTKSAAAIGALVAPRSLAKPPPAARSTCGIALARLGVEAKPIAPIHDGACSVPEPVSVAALGGGVTDFTTRAVVGCDLAEVLATWLKDEAQPAAQKYLGGKIVGLRIAASYTCRTRNGVAGAKLSEHGRGNAIDISAFNVEGRGWIKVGGAHGLGAARFLGTLRKSACGPFKTVLGPGSDSYHSDHFHFDLAQRSNRGKSRGLYCR